MRENKNVGKIVLAAVIGLSVGGALGILFAPDKGSKTRSRLMNRNDEQADEQSDEQADEKSTRSVRGNKMASAARKKQKNLIEN